MSRSLSPSLCAVLEFSQSLRMPFFTLSSNVGMRASGFIGSALMAMTGKPLLAQEMPTKVSANRPTAISVKRNVLMTEGPAIPAWRYHAYR